MFKIAITGPESTGKTVLAKQLADHYKTIWIPEYSRKYLEKADGLYLEKDLFKILKGQINAEIELASKANKFLFCDTDPLVIWIWSQVKYASVDQRIEKILQDHHYDFYLLTSPDLAWQKDELRESEGQLNELFEMYLNKLNDLGRSYAIISGSGTDRLECAIVAIDKFEKSYLDHI